MLKKKRKLGVKVYQYKENVTTKKAAQEIADMYRKQKWLVRVVPFMPAGHTKPASYDIYVHYR